MSLPTNSSRISGVKGGNPQGKDAMAAGEVMPVARRAQTNAGPKGFRQIGRQRGCYGGTTDTSLAR